MIVAHIELLAAANAINALKTFVSDYKIHPILVNFTAALIPVSVGADIFARILKKESLRATAWWTLVIAACITPFTAIAGWLFWMKDDVGVTGMTIHKWLGTSLAILLVGLVLWRWWSYRKVAWPSVLYLCAGIVVMGALAYQGHLGGDQSFGSMDSSDSEHSTADHSASTPSGEMPGMKMPATHSDQRSADSGPSTTSSSGVMPAASSQPALQWHDHIELKHQP
jgi:uncharacterized membrane protein